MLKNNIQLHFSAALLYCKVLLSEYAYHRGSVYRSEGTSDANCRMYSTAGGADLSIRPEEYIHCDGTKLRLTDSDYGSQEYNTSDYYVWPAGSWSQLLFIFPTRVNLTTITLHYYSDNVRGLPRLRFYAVPDDFDVWDASISSYSHVDVADVSPGEDPAGHRNVNLSFNSTTMKILLYKFTSEFSFALTEVEFFNDSCTSLKVSSLTRDFTTASQYHFNVTEIASTVISITLSKLLVGSKIILIIMYVSVCCSS